MTAKEPNQRYSSVEAVLRDMDRYMLAYPTESDHVREDIVSNSMFRLPKRIYGSSASQISSLVSEFTSHKDGREGFNAYCS